MTTAAPYFTITWDIPTQLLQSGAFPTSSPSALSAANSGYLQSFPNANSKNFFGGTPYSAATTGSYLLMYFQPVHPGLLLGSDAPQGYANALAASDPGGATLGATEYGGTPAYTVNLQGVGVGPQPMFLPGVPSKAVTLSQLYTSQTHTTKAVGFTPTSVQCVASVVSTTGVSLTSPTSVKVLPSGALVIADSTLGLVLVQNGSASVLSTGSIKLSSTGGLGLDLSGNIYVADPTGGQVVELMTSAPGSASFPDTLKPDSSGSHTSTETSYVENDGNATLNFSADPTLSDKTSSAMNEFSLDGNNSCVATTSLAPNANCSLVLDFTPSSTAVVYTPVTGAATIADNVQGYTVIANPAFGSGAIGSFGNTGSTQNVNLTGNPVVPFTPQTISFNAPAPLTYSASIPPVQLTATGGVGPGC